MATSWDDWIKSTATYLEDTYGLASDFAGSMARFLAYCTSYGLSPRPTSGYRDPKHQDELRARWDAGDRAGLRARPAADSLHEATNWIGHPAAQALDVATSNDGKAAQIARALGIGCGADFHIPDHGHYYDKGAR